MALSAIAISLEYGLHSTLNLEHSEPANVKAIENMLLVGGVGVGLGLSQVNLAFNTIIQSIFVVLALVAINDTYHWGNHKRIN